MRIHIDWINDKDKEFKNIGKRKAILEINYRKIYEYAREDRSKSLPAMINNNAVNVYIHSRTDKFIAVQVVFISLYLSFS